MEQTEINVSPNAPKSIYIIGGGISGLSVAYYLCKIGKDLDIHICEKEPQLGGNCVTYNVVIDDQNPASARWVDMGVNDYNAETYEKLILMMDDVGFDYKNSELEDTESFSSTDASMCYTLDGAFDTDYNDPDFHTDLEQFKTNAAYDFKHNMSTYGNDTLEDYLANSWKPWGRTKPYGNAFIYNNLYPRVNGMYFCGGKPEKMPFRAIMSYYSLQEGYGGKPNRRYFKGGSKLWIDTLTGYLTNKTRSGSTVTIHTGVVAKIELFSPKARVVMDGRTYYPDAVVLSTPADKRAECFNHVVPEEIDKVLRKFTYFNTDSTIVHKDIKCLPPLVSWRTYNIHAYDPARNDGLYTITYVGNRHQNDWAKRWQKPVFFISCNPHVNPEDRFLLKKTDGTYARTLFGHLKINFDCITGQGEMDSLQNFATLGLYFANGYMIGAGLHEECLENSWKVARLIIGQQVTEQYHFDLSPDARQVVPDYLLNMHKRREEAAMSNK